MDQLKEVRKSDGGLTSHVHECASAKRVIVADIVRFQDAFGYSECCGDMLYRTQLPATEDGLDALDGRVETEEIIVSRVIFCSEGKFHR